MADKKISELAAATTPLDGTEVLAIVQSGSTKKATNNDLRPKQIQSNTTSGVLQITGPATASTRIMTTPDTNFTVSRTDAAQTFTGTQTFLDSATFSTVSGNVNIGTSGDTGNGKTVVRDTAKNQLCIYGYSQTGGSNDPSGQMQLGSAPYNGKIQYNGSSGRLLIDNTYDADTGDILFRTKTSGSALTGLTIFGTSGVSVGGTTDPGAGNLRVNTGNLVIGTSGKGIDFSADGSAAGMTSELLDDYEEGTFTPVFADAASGGNEATVFTALGRYTKVGRLVSYQLALVNIDTTGLTAGNAAVITGFPFTSANISSYSLPVASVGQSSVTTLTGKIWGILTNNSSYLQLIEGRTTGSTDLLVSTLISGSADLFISGQYLTA